MKINRQHHRIARVLWHECIADGFPDISAINSSIAVLQSGKNRQKEFILKALLDRISLFIRENRLNVSSPDELSENRKKQILSAIGRTDRFFGGITFKKDESMIAGLKLEKGYDIEDYSVSKQLERVKNRLLKN
jgi:F0F1-type ATP synthase delta subunit